MLIISPNGRYLSILSFFSLSLSLLGCNGPYCRPQCLPLPQCAKYLPSTSPLTKKIRVLAIDPPRHSGRLLTGTVQKSTWPRPVDRPPMVAPRPPTTTRGCLEPPRTQSRAYQSNLFVFICVDWHENSPILEDLGGFGEQIRG